jgi:uncharacterized protein (TIGR03435 family)
MCRDHLTERESAIVAGDYYSEPNQNDPGASTLPMISEGKARIRPLYRVLCVVAAIATAHGQELAFEVASVKINTSEAPVSRMTAPDGTGRFEATNVPVRMLILNAYGIPGFQLAGGPSWIESLRVDVLARGAAGATRAEISAMVRTLLAERFNLVLRREPREMPVYALVVARDDRRLGPRMQASTTDCTASAKPGGPAPQTASGQLLCTTRMTPFTLNAGGMTMARLAQTLSGIVDRVVTDETKLQGGYDLQLSYTPERPPPPGAPPPADPDAPSIFAALQEQLGLKLDARRGKVEMLVIDRIDQPRGN